MKKRSFWGKRGLAVATSLVLCTSLIMPSFAANFNDLQAAIRGGYTGNAFEVTESGTNRTVKLNEDVVRGTVGQDGKADGTGSVAVHKDSKPITVTIDLNGYTIDGKDASAAVFYVQHGSNLTVEGQSGTIIGNSGSTVLVENGTFNMNGGTISGNTNGVGVKLINSSTFNMNGGTISGNKGGGVLVNGGTFTMKDGTITGNANAGVQVSGGTFNMEGTATISGNTNSGVQVNGGTFTMKNGTISGNSISQGSAGGGGVYVLNGGSFTMTGGDITGNEAKLGSGGGVGVVGSGSTFKMSGGTISGNTVANQGGQGGGGGVWVKSGATFEMTGGTITNNTVEGTGGNGGGVAIHQATFEMKLADDGTYGSIYGNHSDRGTGVLINATEGQNTSHFTMSGGYVSGDGESCIWLEEEGDRNAWLDLSGAAVLDGKIYLGVGTQITMGDAVSKDHYWSDVMVSDGDDNVIDKLTPDEATSYEAGTAASAEVHYTHQVGTELVENGNGHSYSCKYCPKPMTDPVAHNWRVVEVSESTNEDEGITTTTTKSECPDCLVTKTEEKTTEVKPNTGETGNGETGNGEEPPVNPAPPVTTTPVTPAPPVVIDDGDVPLGEAPEEGEAELEMIEDEAVPLAGLFTRAEAIGYLWEQAGSPDAALSDFADVPEDHEWAVAIGWAQEMGIAVADEDGNFLPDDLLLRSTEESQGEFQEFLNRYAVFAGIELDDGELFIELDGDPDDIIMGEDAQEIFDGFFASLETTVARRRD